MAIVSIGMRSAALCSEARKLSPVAAAASAPTPINKRKPLIAKNAVQAALQQDKKQTDEADREAAALTVFLLCRVNFHILFGHRVLSVPKRLQKKRTIRALPANARDHAKKARAFRLECPGQRPHGTLGHARSAPLAGFLRFRSKNIEHLDNGWLGE